MRGVLTPIRRVHPRPAVSFDRGIRQWQAPISVRCTTASSFAASNSEEKTKGGIIIPDTAKEKPQEGEIVAVGSGARDESGKVVPLDVKAGDRILFGKWSGTEVKIDGEDLLIMKEADIMGVIG